MEANAALSALLQNLWSRQARWQGGILSGYLPTRDLVMPTTFWRGKTSCGKRRVRDDILHSLWA